MKDLLASQNHQMVEILANEKITCLLESSADITRNEQCSLSAFQSLEATKQIYLNKDVVPIIKKTHTFVSLVNECF